MEIPRTPAKLSILGGNVPAATVALTAITENSVAPPVPTLCVLYCTCYFLADGAVTVLARKVRVQKL